MKTYDISDLLRKNPYPGRGIILGRSKDGRYAVAAYFIMGRSKNSRNRIFVKTEDGIQTQAFDPAAMTDPSLIIYHPVRDFLGCTIVTNGDQTDTIRDFMAVGRNMHAALMTRSFEPDAPNYTPRVSGVIAPGGAYSLSIIKTLNGDPGKPCRNFFEYESPVFGMGHFIHTYVSDGEPLPSFEGEPVPVRIDCPDAASFADALWTSLDAQNKVSLYVRYIDIVTGISTVVIKNKNE